MPPPDDLRAAAAHHRAGRLDEAAALYARVVAAEPGNTTALHLLGRIALDHGRPDDAVAWVQRAVAAQPTDPALHRSLAEALSAAGRPVEARRQYEQLVSLQPRDASAWLALGEILSQLGQLLPAQAALRQAVTADPTQAAGWWGLAMTGQADVAPQLRALLARQDLQPADRINLLFALARLLDTAGAYDEAFAQLDTASDMLRERQAEPFNPDQLRAYVDQRILGCSSDLLRRLHGGGSDSDLPVFVVGMPRSGTTLVEQILASHSQVRGIGEGHQVALLVHELDPNAVGYEAWHATAARGTAERYIAQLRARARGARRVVDKTPDNLFHLAAIAVLFPAARIIVCRRDPRDTCLSCYFQNFAYPAPYANDLAACAVRHQQVDRLLAHWRGVLPLRMHEVHYESLVAGLEGESRRLVEFLGLDWEPACLNFHRNRQPVRSASQWQVRRPLYASSVGRWRHYTSHIAPLLKAFGRE